jgi:hypothetical protein
MPPKAHVARRLPLAEEAPPVGTRSGGSSALDLEEGRQLAELEVSSWGERLPRCCEQSAARR